MTENYIENVTSNVLGRYVSLNFVYNLRVFTGNGKKKFNIPDGDSLPGGHRRGGLPGPPRADVLRCSAARRAHRLRYAPDRMSGAYSISAICHSDGSQREGCFPLLHACDVFLWLRFYEMGVSVPVFSINPVFASVEIELVHPESDHEVF